MLSEQSAAYRAACPLAAGASEATFCPCAVILHRLSSRRVPPPEISIGRAGSASDAFVLFLACLRCAGGCFSPIQASSAVIRGPRGSCNLQPGTGEPAERCFNHVSCGLCRPHPSSSGEIDVFLEPLDVFHTLVLRDHWRSGSRNSRARVCADDVSTGSCWAEGTKRRLRQWQEAVVWRGGGGVLSAVLRDVPPPRPSPVSAPPGRVRRRMWWRRAGHGTRRWPWHGRGRENRGRETDRCRVLVIGAGVWRLYGEFWHDTCQPEQN